MRRNRSTPPAALLIVLPVAAAVLAACSPVHDVDVGVIESGLVVCAKGATIEGIDVSHWDGVIDWNKVKGAGVTFAVIKATEHLMFVDNTFATNWKGAGQAGVVRGAYHFFRPAFDGVMQADFFLATTGLPGPGDLPPTLDLEAVDGIAPATVAQRALAFLDRVEKVTGRRPIIYTSARFMASIGDPPGFGRYPLWDAHWGVMCPNIPSPEWADWKFWQYTDTGAVPGINAMVDLNRFNGSLADLMAFLKPVVPDAGVPPDLSAPRDLATVRDLASATDATMAPLDLSRPADLTSAGAADLTPVPTSDDLMVVAGDAASNGGTGAITSGCGCDLTARRPASPLSGALSSLALLGLIVGLRRRRPGLAS